MPKFAHDCSKCKYLGTFRIGLSSGKTHVADLYFHRGEELTVVARYGDEGQDYSSGLELPSRDLLLATLRAVKKGMLQTDEIPDYWIEEE